MVDWRDALVAERAYVSVLGPWRNAMVHRDIRYIWRDAPAGPLMPEDWTWKRRRIAEIGVEPLSGGTFKIMLPDDVLGVVSFGFAQAALFCDALAASLGDPRRPSRARSKTRHEPS